MSGIGGFARLVISSLPRYSNATGKVATGLIGAGLGYGLSEEMKEFIAANASSMNRTLEEKRVREAARVEGRARGRKVLYHYSSRAAVIGISVFGVELAHQAMVQDALPGFMQQIYLLGVFNIHRKNYRHCSLEVIDLET